MCLLSFLIFVTSNSNSMIFLLNSLCLHCQELQWKISGTLVKELQSGFHYSDPLYTVFHCTKLQLITTITGVEKVQFLLQSNKCRNYNHRIAA